MRNEGIMHPFTISHRRRHGIWPRSRGREIRGGAVESRASTGKVELKRIFGGVESVNRGSKRTSTVSNPHRRRYQAGTHLRRTP